MDVGAMAAGCVPAVADSPPALKVAAASTPSPAPSPAQPPAPKPLPGPADFSFRGSVIQGGTLIGRVPGGTRALTLDGAPVPIAADGASPLYIARTGMRRWCKCWSMPGRWPTTPAIWGYRA